MTVKINHFPDYEELETVATLRQYDLLYHNNALAVLGVHEIIKKQYDNLAHLVYISHAIPAHVSDFYGDFVAGDIDQMIMRVSENDDQSLLDDIIIKNDLPESIIDFATDQSEFGYTVLYTYLSMSGETIVTTIPQDQYFPQSDGSVIIASYKKDPNDETGNKLYLYTQHFQEIDSNVLVERQAFECNEKGVAVQEISLNVIERIVEHQILPEYRLNTNKIPIVQVDNGRKQSDGFGKSDYADIIPNLAEINERTTQISTQFLKNLDAKMQLPEGMREPDGSVKSFDTVFVDSKDQAEAKYIVNTNTMISDAQEHILAQLRIVSEITAVPMFSLLKSSSAPERVESLRIQLFSAIRKTHRKRSKLSRGLQDIIRIAYELNGTTLKEDPIITFGDVVPNDDYTVAETESTKVASGLSSKVKSIMRLEGISRDEAETELEQIVKESVTSGIVNPIPPQVTTK